MHAHDVASALRELTVSEQAGMFHLAAADALLDSSATAAPALSVAIHALHLSTT
ncbi:hypothetical protein [Streptomyces sp. NPDC006335]|uniref:hypothetical protein n=1 Tax=Streptomyces sp. NPDC006335 TaxID=3156895 RepID=UPI0033A0D1A0